METPMTKLSKFIDSLLPRLEKSNDPDEDIDDMLYALYKSGKSDQEIADSVNEIIPGSSLSKKDIVEWKIFKGIDDDTTKRYVDTHKYIPTNLVNRRRPKKFKDRLEYEFRIIEQEEFRILEVSHKYLKDELIRSSSGENEYARSPKLYGEHQLSGLSIERITKRTIDEITNEYKLLECYDIKNKLTKIIYRHYKYIYF